MSGRAKPSHSHNQNPYHRPDIATLRRSQLRTPREHLKYAIRGLQSRICNLRSTISNVAGICCFPRRPGGILRTAVAFLNKYGVMNPEIIRKINQDIGVAVSRIEAANRLLEEGATIPFIARYRKEATGNLDEVQIRDIAERRIYYNELDERRKVVLSKIEEQGKLTDELRDKIPELLHQGRARGSLPPLQGAAEDQGRHRPRAWAGAPRRLSHDGVRGGVGRERSGEVREREKEVPTAEAAIEGALHTWPSASAKRRFPQVAPRPHV